MTTPLLIRSDWNLKLTIFQIKLAFNQQNRKVNHKKRHNWLLMWHISVFTHSVLPRMLIGLTHSPQFMKWKNLGITTLKHATCATNVYLKLLENQITTNFIYLTSSNFVTISHVNYWDQVNSWKNLWKFWDGPLYRNKSGLSPYSVLQYIGRVATPKLVARNCLRYLQTTLIVGVEDWSQNLCEYYLKKLVKNERGFGKTWHFFSLNSLLLMFAICQMVLGLIGSSLITLTLKETEASKLRGDIMDFCH